MKLTPEGLARSLRNNGYSVPVRVLEAAMHRGVAQSDDCAAARIERLEADNAILRAKASGVVYVCPECDIAGCRHVRAALQEGQP